jgi:nitroreductase
MKHTKYATTRYPVMDIIKSRWSPRSFSGKEISETDINTILEAASWSFSAINEQPWRYIVAHKGTPLFDTFFNALFPGNQPWNKRASALVLSLQKTTFSSNGNANGIALHDVGAANMLLTIQANSLGVYTHLMGGFDKEKATAGLQIPADTEAVVMIALGYPDDAEKLETPFKERETAPRSRKQLSEIVLEQV